MVNVVIDTLSTDQGSTYGFDRKHGAGLNHDKIDQRLPTKKNATDKSMSGYGGPLFSTKSHKSLLLTTTNHYKAQSILLWSVLGNAVLGAVLPYGKHRVDLG